MVVADLARGSEGVDGLGCIRAAAAVIESDGVVCPRPTVQAQGLYARLGRRGRTTTLPDGSGELLCSQQVYARACGPVRKREREREHVPTIYEDSAVSSSLRGERAV